MVGIAYGMGIAHQAHIPPGKISGMGCSYIGFVRGDGLGYAVQSGIRAADSMVRYVENADFGRINPEQVSELKEKI